MSMRVTAQNRAEKRVLAWLAENSDDGMDFCSFAPICSELNLTRAAVRRACRALARKELAVYARGLWDEDGPRGAGYAITDRGREAAQ